MTEDNYRPRSPDFSSLPFPSNLPPYASASASASAQAPTAGSASASASGSSPIAHRASYDDSPFFNAYQRPGSSRVPQQYIPPYQPAFFDEMARRSSRLQPEDAPIPEAPIPMAVAPPMEVPEPPQAPLGAGIEVKTKFPVARIKRIMQADEDVGKVAQVTPIAVCMSFPHLPFPTSPRLMITN